MGASLLKFSLLLAAYLGNGEERGREWGVKLRCQFPTCLTLSPLGCPGSLPGDPPVVRNAASSSQLTPSHQKPGLSHPKAQRLCLRPPTAEKKEHFASFTFRKPTLQQMTGWERPGLGDPADRPQAGFHTARTWFQVPQIGTRHLPLEGLSWERGRLNREESARRKGRRPFFPAQGGQATLCGAQATS